MHEKAVGFTSNVIIIFFKLIKFTKKFLIHKVPVHVVYYKILYFKVKEKKKAI